MSDTDIIDDEPRPLLSLASTPEVVHHALELLDAGVPTPLSRAKHEAVFRAAAERAHGKRRTPALRLSLAFATACLLGALTTAGLVSVLRAPEVVAAPGAIFTFEDSTLTIERGHLEVKPRRAMTVHAGSVELSLQRGTFAMDVADGTVSVHVEQGEAVVRDAEGEQRLTAGQTLAIAPPQPVQLELVDARTPSCGDGQTDCLTTLAVGDGLEAETALYELALTAHERGDTAAALAHFSEHQRRFFDGVLAPEASVGLILSQLAAHDRAAAAAEARRFVERFPTDPRADRVRALAR